MTLFGTKERRSERDPCLPKPFFFFATPALRRPTSIFVVSVSFEQVAISFSHASQASACRTSPRRMEGARARTPTAGGHDGWCWADLHSVPNKWSASSARCVLEFCDRRYLDVYMTMIPKVSRLCDKVCATYCIQVMGLGAGISSVSLVRALDVQFFCVCWHL